MLIDLHSITISLRSKDDRINGRWRHYFDLELASHYSWNEDTKPDIILEAKVESTLPSLPSVPIYYKSSDPPLTIFEDQEQYLLLRLSDLSQVQLRLPLHFPTSNNDPTHALIIVTETSLNIGILEDITTLALAPILRRHGLFLIHAFTAALNHEAVMFVGPSGSGKTSSGLALISAGWHILANDMALIRKVDVPRALLSPGTVQIAPTTMSLLPHYEQLIKKYPRRPGEIKTSIPRREFIDTKEILWSAPIKTIFFPSIGEINSHVVEAVPRAVGLARLMESSMDQWDQGIWEVHIGFLEKLSCEVDFFELYLGNDMVELPAFIKNVLV
jgi:hypothetical protein